MSVQSFHQLSLTCDNPNCQVKSNEPITHILGPDEAQCVRHAKAKGWGWEYVLPPIVRFVWASVWTRF